MSYETEVAKFNMEFSSVNFDELGFEGETLFRQFEKNFGKIIRLIGKVDRKSFKGHYFYTSGFVEVNGQLFYISISDVRYFPQMFHKSVLYRTAKDTRDFSGGRNNYCELSQLKEKLENFSK